jgi:hypothetical protein
MNKILPTIIAGFGAAVLSAVPFLKNFSCCLLIPTAAVVALFLDMKVNKNLERIDILKAIFFGLLTGFFATIFFVIFDLTITFLAKTNDFVESLPQTEILINQMNIGKFAEEPIKMMKSMAEDIKTSGFSILYTILMLISNFFINSFFGIIGGIIGMNILNRKMVDYTE